MSHNYAVSLRDLPDVEVEADGFRIEDGNYVFYKTDGERIHAFNILAVRFVARKQEDEPAK